MRCRADPAIFLLSLGLSLACSKCDHVGVADRRADELWASPVAAQQHLGGQSAAIVVVGQHRAVGTGRSEKRPLRAFFQRRQQGRCLAKTSVLSQMGPASLLRHQAARAGVLQGQNVVIGLVEGRAHQVVHTRVQQQEP